MGTSDLDMRDENRFRRINLGTAFQKFFTVAGSLNPADFRKVIDYWGEKHSLHPVWVKELQPTEHGEVLTGSFLIEGGTAWTLNLERYRKKINAYFAVIMNYTYVQLNMELPGAYGLSRKDLEKAKEMLDVFKLFFVNLTQTTAINDNP